MERKRQRVGQRNKIRKEMMESPKNDAVRGITYEARIAIETDIFQIPTTIKEIERKTIWRRKLTIPGKVDSNADTRLRNPNSANTTVKMKYFYSRRRWRNT